MVAIITGRGPRYTPGLHCMCNVARAPSISFQLWLFPVAFCANLQGLTFSTTMYCKLICQ